MDTRNIRILMGILLLTGFSVWVSVVNLDYIANPKEQGNQPWWATLLVWQGSQERSIKVHQGLDLQGGLQVVLQADLPQGQTLQEGVMEAARVIVDNRVNGLGVTEPLVQLQGSNRIIVELPGIDNPELAISTLRETGLLEFVDGGLKAIPEGSRIRTSLGDPKPRKGQASGVITDGKVISPTALGASKPLTEEIQIYQPDKAFETIITGGDLAEVSNAGIDPNSRQIRIDFSLKSDGGKKFGNYSGANIGKHLCIVLDKTVLSCPTIQARIETNGTITLGGSNLEQGQALAIQLRYGALPVPLTVVENRTVGPTLGQDSIQKSLRAGTIGLIVVLLLMVTYYRLPGSVAGLALIVYGLLNFALYKLLPVTITLPGITGFILSVGMAVDANILIFERMKEELRAGRKLKTAMELGFTRSWPPIRDSAVSTLIICVILFWFGSNYGASIVKGFAITLGLGVFINIFTAVTVTRALLRFVINVIGEDIAHNVTLMGFSLEKSETPESAPRWVANLMNIVQHRNFYYMFSLTLIVVGIIGMVFSTIQFRTPLKLGIDFTSGSLMELQFEKPVQPNEVRQIFTAYRYEDTDFNDTNVTTAEQMGRQTILVRSKFLEEDAKTKLQQQIKEKIGPFTELRFDSVGPAIGREVAQAGSSAVLAAAMFILLYLVFAFRSVSNPLRYGVAAVAAMLHDVLVTTGLFALAGIFFDWEVDALFLTAILTVIGYSVHDTIIVFDRLRENLPQRRSEDFEVVCNRSILETFSRSILTPLTAIFVIVSILFFGGATVKHFVAIMLVGTISGTYSSIFNAVPILVTWQKGEFGQFFCRLTGQQKMDKATVQPS